MTNDMKVLTENWNDFTASIDQYKYLRDEEDVSEEVLEKVEKKFEKVAVILETSEASVKLREIQVLLDAQERLCMEVRKNA